MQIYFYPKQEKYFRDNLPRRKTSEFVRNLVNFAMEAVERGEVTLMDVYKGEAKLCKSESSKNP